MNVSLAVLILSSLLPTSVARLGAAPAVENDRKLKNIPRKHRDKTARKREHHRIINGTVASPGEFPYFVDFGYCGASLIHEDIVLTASHCADEFVSEVYIGAFREQFGTFGDETDEDAEVREIVTSRAHPNYDSFTVENDVMVLKLNSPSTHTPVGFNDDSSKPIAGEGLTAIGHGVTDEFDYFTPEELNKVTVPYVPHDECSASIAAAAEAEFLDPDLYLVSEDTMLCAGGTGGDTCYGDSGGPLVGEDGIQVGITSWGIRCGLEGTPGVYTRISGVADWIKEQICALSDNPPSDCPPRGCHLPDVSEEDCPPDRLVVRAVPPDGETGGFDYDIGATTVFYHSQQLTPLCAEEHVYQNQNGLTYNLVADEDLQCPGTITLQTSTDGTDVWNQDISGPLALTESSSNDGKFYCSYELQDFAVRLNKCLGRQDGDVTVQVQIVYDSFSYENGWSISQDGTVLAGRSTGAVEEYGLVSENVYLSPGDYTFSITDIYGDGIYSGSWKLVAGETEGGPVLAEGDGEFLYGTNATFTVPDGPIPTAPPGSTTPPPTDACEDSTSTFLINESVGDQACSWLADNLDLFEFLCRLTDIALTCRKTCGICDLL